MSVLEPHQKAFMMSVHSAFKGVSKAIDFALRDDADCTDLRTVLQEIQTALYVQCKGIEHSAPELFEDEEE